jgi:hypothetical protein
LLVEGWVVKELEKCDFQETNYGQDIHGFITDGVIGPQVCVIRLKLLGIVGSRVAPAE